MSAHELADNPFWVLELSPTASRLEARRAADRLLGLLAISAASARTYRTPFGPRPRDEALVRHALAALDSVEARLLDELWAEAPELPSPPAPSQGWDGALASIGWGVSCTESSR
jgi:hypothetical protein